MTAMKSFTTCVCWLYNVGLILPPRKKELLNRPDPHKYIWWGEILKIMRCLFITKIVSLPQALSEVCNCATDRFQAETKNVNFRMTAKIIWRCCDILCGKVVIILKDDTSQAWTIVEVVNCVYGIGAAAYSRSSYVGGYSRSSYVGGFFDTHASTLHAESISTSSERIARFSNVLTLRHQCLYGNTLRNVSVLTNQYRVGHWRRNVQRRSNFYLPFQRG